MVRRPIRVLLAAVAVASAAAALAQARGSEATAASSRADSGSTSQAALAGLVCHHALRPSNRSISTTAVMRPIPGTLKLAVNFRLVRRSPAGTSSSVRGVGLGIWLTKSLGQHPVDVWRVIHTVSDLSAPASYRFEVAFRWIGSGGQILAHVIHRSRRCRQPELRPDLEVQSIAVLADASDSSKDDYLAEIYDAGARGAGPFLVQLADQGQLVNRWVPRIDRHQSLSVRFVGPLCSGSDPPTVTVDPHHRVDVYSRAQASLTATCPAPTAGASRG